MNMPTYTESKRTIMQIADDMAAAASSMNAQNYETLISCRKKLADYVELLSIADCERTKILTNFREELINLENKSKK
jgi:hypothetical protein